MDAQGVEWSHLVEGREALDARPEVSSRQQQLNNLWQLNTLVLILPDVHLARMMWDGLCWDG